MIERHRDEGTVRGRTLSARIARTGLFWVVLAALAAPSSAGPLSLERPGLLAEYMMHDNPTFRIGVSQDRDPAAAVSPSGTALIFWVSADYQSGDDDADSPDVVWSRSADGGRTWSEPAYAYPDVLALWASAPSVATNGSGVWVAAFTGDPNVEQVIRSTDDGLTWSLPVSVGIPGSFGAPRTTVAYGGAGTWIVAWYSRITPTADTDIYFVRSTDDGETWSSVSAINVNAAADTALDSDPRLASDGSGNWVAVWSRNQAPVAAYSMDDGQTWSAHAFLGSGLGSGLPNVRVATDREGTWIATWHEGATLGPNGEHHTIRFARSTDNGVTWTAKAPVVGTPWNDTGGMSNARLLYRGNGAWTAAWYTNTTFGRTIGSDADYLYADSLDGGLTWEPPALLNLSGRLDGTLTDGIFDLSEDNDLDLASDGQGTTLAVWWSRYNPGKAYGVDLDILYSVSHDDCPVEPSPDCFASVGPGRSRLLIKDGNGGRDKLLWRWGNGEATAAEDLGDPASSSSYALCLYALVGSSLRVVLEADAPAGATCRKGACWGATGSGFRFRDSEGLHGPIRTLAVSAGAAGEPSITVGAGGPALAPPSLPLDVSQPVQAQLHNLETGTCWGASFSTPAANTARRFKATSN